MQTHPGTSTDLLVLSCLPTPHGTTQSPLQLLGCFPSHGTGSACTGPSPPPQRERLPGTCVSSLVSLALAPPNRIPAWSGLEGTSVGHPVPPPAQAGSPRAGCTAPHPGGSGISPEKETPQPPWAAWARAPSPSEGRSSSSCSDGASSASVCARCPLSCHWAPLERVWPCTPNPHPADIYKHL